MELTQKPEFAGQIQLGALMKPPFRSRFTIAGAAAMFLFVPISLGGNAQQIHKLGKKEVKALIASAKTPGDHEQLAAYYRGEAEGLTAEQREHEEELQEYYKNSSRYPGKYPTMGDHCRSLAGYYGKAAQKALALADMHEQLAKEVRGNEANPR